MRALVATALAALVLAAPAAAFRLGVASGDVRPTSATLWTRADSAGPVVLELWAPGSPRRALRTVAQTGSDLTVNVRVRRLRPSTLYRYRFRQGATASRTGSFRTAPRPGADAAVELAWSGDSDGTVNPRTGKLAFGGFDVLKAAAAERPDLFVYLGDTIYADSFFGQAAQTVDDYRAKYRQNRSIPALRELEARTSVVAQWDDHEVRNDWDPASVAPELVAVGAQAFHEYQPLGVRPGRPLYRSFRWGRNLELFALDLRSYRSPSARDSCRNPPGGTPDPAPLLPQATRDAFAGIVPAFAQPVPEACRAALFDPGRTLLGAAQLAWLERGLARSDATWKVVLTPDPIQEFALTPYDRWEGYQTERSALLQFIRDRRIENVVWLAADTHATLVKDVTLGGAPTGMVEVVTGPIGTGTFGQGLAALAGPDAVPLVTGFLRSLGARCVELDRYSYGLLRADGKRLVLDSRDARGRSVCGGSLVLRAREMAGGPGRRAGLRPLLPANRAGDAARPEARAPGGGAMGTVGRPIRQAGAQGLPSWS